jgi:hypothetical protein
MKLFVNTIKHAFTLDNVLSVEWLNTQNVSQKRLQALRQVSHFITDLRNRNLITLDTLLELTNTAHKKIIKEKIEPFTNDLSLIVNNAILELAYTTETYSNTILTTAKLLLIEPIKD